MSNPPRPKLRFQSGGTLRRGAFYVERAADQELPAALARGEFCYVLAPRQIGKSSLRVRCAQKLQSQGVRCVSVDLNMAGTKEAQPSAWYYSLVQEIWLQLSLPGDPWEFWQQHEQTTATYRFTLFLRHVLLTHVKEPMILFIDEIDNVLALPFSTDDFFAAIRAVYNDRAEDERLHRLTFCLLGVAAPADLIQNPVLTPFNIGRAIALEDLTQLEAQAFLPGLHSIRGDAQKLLQAVLSYTDGHPYMTQRLCESLINAKDLGTEEGRVQRQVEQVFLAEGRSRDPNLAYAEKRLDKNPKLISMLRIYGRLLEGQPVEHEREDPVQMELRLAGLVARRTVNGRSFLQVRNRIFASVFDSAWLQAHRVHRLLDEPMRRWLSSDKQGDFLLRGEALRQSLSWAAGRRDLTPDEHEFLRSALEVERQTEQQRREDAEAQRQIEMQRRQAAELQRQAEEDNRKAIEARRQAEHEQLLAFEEQRRAERARQQAEYERERALAQSQVRRQTIVLLSGALCILSVILAALAWQATIARRNQREADRQRGEAELAKRHAVEAQLRAIEGALAEKGLRSAYQASQPGRQAPALVAALEWVWPSIKAGQPPPAQAVESLSLATGAGVFSYRLKKHTDEWVRSAAFSPDGKTFVTAGNDGRVYFWDGENYCPRGTLNAHTDQIRQILYSPNGERLLTASTDHTAKVWDAATHRLLVRLKGHEAGLRSAMYSPDGRRIITSSDDNTAVIWDAETGTPLLTLREHPADRYAIYSPDGNYIATAGASFSQTPDDTKRAWLWNASTGASIGSLAGHAEPLRAIAYSPSGEQLATASVDSTIRVWDVRSGITTAVLAGHTETVRSVIFSADGRYILSASDDKTARLWDAKTALPLLTLLGHTESVRSAIFSPDMKRVVTTSVDRSVRVWYIQDGKTLVNLTGHKQWVCSATYSPDGRNIVTASEDWTARIWDAATGTEQKKLIGHKSDVRSAVYSPDGTRILTASNDRTARVWDARTGQLLFVLEGEHSDTVQSAAYSLDGQRIVTSSSDKTAIIWDAAKHTKLQTFSGHSKLLHSAYFSPDGTRILTTSGDKTARIWNAQTGATIAVLSGHQDEVFSGRYSPDGKLVVTGALDNMAYVWDANAHTGDRYLLQLQGHAGGVWSTEFSPDSQQVLTASNDQTARIWDSHTGNLLMTLAGHTGGLTSAAFSPPLPGHLPDDLRVVTASRDHVAVIHPIRIADYFRIACNLWWVQRDSLEKADNATVQQICQKEIGKWPPAVHRVDAARCTE